MSGKSSDYSGQMVPARTTPPAGTSALTVAPLPMRAPAPMFTSRLTVTPMPIRLRSPTFTDARQNGARRNIDHFPQHAIMRDNRAGVDDAAKTDLHRAADIGMRENLHACGNFGAGFHHGAGVNHGREVKTRPGEDSQRPSDAAPGCQFRPRH